MVLIGLHTALLQLQTQQKFPTRQVVKLHGLTLHFSGFFKHLQFLIPVE